MALINVRRTQKAKMRGFNVNPFPAWPELYRL